MIHLPLWLGYDKQKNGATEFHSHAAFHQSIEQSTIFTLCTAQVSNFTHNIFLVPQCWLNFRRCGVAQQY